MHHPRDFRYFDFTVGYASLRLCRYGIIAAPQGFSLHLL
jgi:hypothetical protein